MTRAYSKKPAKTRRYRVSFVGPKGGHHHQAFTFRLRDASPMPTKVDLQRVARLYHEKGLLTRVVEWYRSDRPSRTGLPDLVLVYAIHKNDIYNSPVVKAGWRISGEG
jgi:hypothetical protein